MEDGPLNQPAPGARPRATTREDHARLDFVEGARGFVIGQLAPAATSREREVLTAAFADARTAPGSSAEVAALVRAEPVVATGHRMMRKVQEMIWTTTHDTLAKRRDTLMAALDAADRQGPGSVWYDRDFTFPAYFANHEFHLQDGGYDDPLAGYVYHLGVNVFRFGTNEDHSANRKIVESLPTPADGRVLRILELGCSAGATSVELKRRFTQAEVWATDLSGGRI